MNLPTIFNAGNAGTFADIQSGGLWLEVLSTTQGLSGGKNPQCYFDFNFYYEDA
jgi:hypothetical protein